MTKLCNDQKVTPVTRKPLYYNGERKSRRRAESTAKGIADVFKKRFEEEKWI